VNKHPRSIKDRRLLEAEPCAGRRKSDGHPIYPDWAGYDDAVRELVKLVLWAETDRWPRWRIPGIVAVARKLQKHGHINDGGDDGCKNDD
jgi:hypothetical protein